MKGVRIVTNVYVWIGWFTLVVGSVATVVVFASLLRERGPEAALPVLLAILPFLALALGPFTIWALLRGIVEIHGQGEQILAETRSWPKQLKVTERLTAPSAVTSDSVQTATHADKDNRLRAPSAATSDSVGAVTDTARVVRLLEYA